MDNTKNIRRELAAIINSEEADRAALEKEYGKCWSTDELKEEFNVKGFAAPFIRVVRKSDGVEGSMTFQHRPRFYFDFRESR